MSVKEPQYSSIFVTGLQISKKHGLPGWLTAPIQISAFPLITVRNVFKSCIVFDSCKSTPDYAAALFLEGSIFLVLLQ